MGADRRPRALRAQALPGGLRASQDIYLLEVAGPWGGRSPYLGLQLNDWPMFCHEIRNTFHIGTVSMHATETDTPYLASFSAGERECILNFLVAHGERPLAGGPASIAALW